MGIGVSKTVSQTQILSIGTARTMMRFGIANTTTRARLFTRCGLRRLPIFGPGDPVCKRVPIGWSARAYEWRMGRQNSPYSPRRRICQSGKREQEDCPNLMKVREQALTYKWTITA